MKNHKKEKYRNRKNKVRNVKRKKFFLLFHWRGREKRGRKIFIKEEETGKSEQEKE